MRKDENSRTFLYARIFIFLFLLLLAHALRAFLSSYNRSSRAEIARRKCPHVPLMYAAVLPLLFQLYLTYSPSFFIRCHLKQKLRERKNSRTFLYAKIFIFLFLLLLAHALRAFLRRCHLEQKLQVWKNSRRLICKFTVFLIFCFSLFQRYDNRKKGQKI